MGIPKSLDLPFCVPPDATFKVCGWEDREECLCHEAVALGLGKVEGERGKDVDRPQEVFRDHPGCHHGWFGVYACRRLGAHGGTVHHTGF